MFGNPRRATDFLYEQELARYCEEGLLTRLDTAFSRDQAHKIYVQQRLEENAARLWDWIQDGAVLYVCGDAKRMAVDVDHALKQVVATQGRMAPAQAAAYLAQLTKQGRYRKDAY